MLSSRCNDPFPRAGGPPLSQARREIKAELEAYKLLDKSLFEVWINEVAPPTGGNWDSWETCLEAVRDCDFLIAIVNGNAGWAAESPEIGICHAELMEGYRT